MISELNHITVSLISFCAVSVSCGVVARLERRSRELKFDLTPYMLCLLTLTQQAAGATHPRKQSDTISLHLSTTSDGGNRKTGR
jgi:hypothetical protein